MKTDLIVLFDATCISSTRDFSRALTGAVFLSRWLSDGEGPVTQEVIEGPLALRRGVRTSASQNVRL